MSAEIEIPKAFADLFKQARYKIYYGGRGAAKSWAFARALLTKAWQKPTQVLCAREIQSSIKESVYSLLKKQIDVLELSQDFECLNSEIRGKNGSRFIFEGLKHNVDRIKSLEDTDICWVEEAAKVSEESWEVLIPTIRKPNSEIWASFNPRLEFDATYQRLIVHRPEGAIVHKVSWRDNPFFTAEMRFEMERLKTADYDAYLHVWEGETKKLTEGAVYGKQLTQARKDGRITKVPVESSVLVNTFWDLGKNDATAIWFHQGVGPQNRFVDYYENRGEELDHYIRILKERDYLYGDHYLPHDVEAKILGMPKTRKTQLEDAGIKPIRVVERTQDVVGEGIEAVRRIFPTCWFDEVKCKQGLEVLGNYAWEMDEDKGIFSPHPIKNWASHGSDAFRQFAQGFSPKADWKPLPKQAVVRWT